MAIGTYSFTVNGNPVTVTVDEATPLLWILRDMLGLTGTKYGCGISVCWACGVLINGQTDKSCDVELQSVQGKTIVTVEGLSALPEGAPSRRPGSRSRSHSAATASRGCSARRR